MRRPSDVRVTRGDRQCPLSPPAGRTSGGLCPSRSRSGVRCWLVGTKGWVTLLSSGWMALHQVGGDGGAEADGKGRCSFVDKNDVFLLFAS